jgi:hypothetical protein
MDNQVNGATGTSAVKRGMAQSLKGGVIMDVMNVEQVRNLIPLQNLRTLQASIVPDLSMLV